MSSKGAAEVRDTITVIKVSDPQRSKDWYSKLLGKGPDLEPFPGNLEFKVGATWIQISKGTVRPSSWSFEVEVRDLRREWERIKGGGIEATEIRTVPGVVSYFDVSDPDENRMRWFQVLTSDPKVTGIR